MKKFISFSLLLAGIVLMANSCSTAPASNNTPAANSNNTNVTPAVPAATTAPVSNSQTTPGQNNPYGTPASNPTTTANTPSPTVSSPTTPAPTPVTPPAAAKAEINIQNFSFNPASVTIAIGGTVVWTNNDPVPHQIASNYFNSSPLSQGDTFTQKFTTAGTFAYHCAIHPSMTGTIIVK